MRNLILVGLLLVGAGALAALTSEQEYKLNHMNSVAYEVSLGTAIGNLEDGTSIGTSAITSAMIYDGTIAAADIGTSAVTGAKINDGTIEAVDLASDAVTSAKILDGTIAAADIATGAVESAEILDATIAAADIGASVITEAKLYNAASDGRNAKRTLRVTYDVTTTPSLGTSTVAHGLGYYLPGKAIIQRSFMQISEVFRGSSGDASTVAFHCEDANNILTAEDLYNDAAGLKAGNQSTGDIGQMTASIANECEVTATVTGAPQTSGKLVLFIDYYVGL